MYGCIYTVFYFVDEEQQKIQVRIKPVEETKKASNPDLTAEQLKELTTTFTLMSPASVVSIFV